MTNERSRSSASYAYYFFPSDTPTGPHHRPAPPRAPPPRLQNSIAPVRPHIQEYGSLSRGRQNAAGAQDAHQARQESCLRVPPPKLGQAQSATDSPKEQRRRLRSATRRSKADRRTLQTRPRGKHQRAVTQSLPSCRHGPKLVRPATKPRVPGRRRNPKPPSKRKNRWVMPRRRPRTPKTTSMTRPKDLKDNDPADEADDEETADEGVGKVTQQAPATTAKTTPPKLTPSNVGDETPNTPDAAEGRRGQSRRDAAGGAKSTPPKVPLVTRKVLQPAPLKNAAGRRCR